MSYFLDKNHSRTKVWNLGSLGDKFVIYNENKNKKKQQKNKKNGSLGDGKKLWGEEWAGKGVS